jgi:hypothetical protein
MDAFAIALIDGIGGTYAVSRLSQASPSTVHAWRRIGLPPSRLNHLRRIVQDECPLVDVAAIAAAHGVELPPIVSGVPSSAGKVDEDSAQVAA